MERTHEGGTIRSHGLGETVEVEATINASVGDIWEAVTRQATLRRWLGTVERDFQVRQDVRLEYLDGDYELLRPLRIEAPRRLDYMARLFGIGPVRNVSWVVEPRGPSSRIVVSETEQFRPEHHSLVSARAWSDQLADLAELFNTGTLSRYRGETPIQASIELPVSPATAAKSLFISGQQQAWLPIDTTELGVGTAFLMPGAHPPKVTELSFDGSQRIHFNLVREGWLSPMSITLELTPRDQGSLLHLSQEGGTVVCFCGTCWLPRRKSWTQVWVDSLQRARQSVG